MNGRVATDAEVAEMRRLYVEQHLTLRQVAELAHFHATTVGRVLREDGVELRPPNRGRRPYLAAEDLLTTTQLYGMGFSTRQIAEMLGLNPSTVQERLQRYGIKSRGRGGNVHAKRIERA